MALMLDLPEIYSMCKVSTGKVSTELNNLLCNNQSFWFNKLERDYDFRPNDFNMSKTYYKMLSTPREDTPDMIYNAAKYRYTDLLKYILNNYKYNLYKEFAIAGAVATDDIEYVKQIIDMEGNDYRDGWAGLSQSRSLEMAEFWISRGVNINESLFYLAERGNLPILKYLVEREGDHILDIGILDDAAFRGHIDIFNYYYSIRGEEDYRWTALEAMRGEHKELAKYILSKTNIKTIPDNLRGIFKEYWYELQK
jgi:hypothetical protein